MVETQARRRAAWRFVRAVVRSEFGGVVGAIVSGLLWQTGAILAPLIVSYTIDHGVVPQDRGTHYHLCAHTPTPSIARGSHLLNAAHAQRFNRRYGRTGHVFHGPYGAELVTDDAHLLGLSRYIALNPVRARLCRRPQDWPWSSYRAMAGFESGPGWLERSFLLEMFSSDREQAQRL